jgi:hypothetical protein
LDQTGVCGIAFETKYLSRDAEAILDLWTDGDPSYVAADRPQQKVVPLVRAVETYFFAVETGTESELESERLGCAQEVLLVSGVIHGYPTDGERACSTTS